jgi:hypothetical protein
LKNFLIFGDSNSWGFTDEDEGQRYDKRWPIVFINHLNKIGISCNLIEDSLPGRTTNIDDGKDGIHLNGSSVFKSSLLANSPIDMVLIMLGTNDLKKRFNREPEGVANGIEDLITIAQSTFSGVGSWHDQNLPKVIILCPPSLGHLAINSRWSNYDEWKGAFEKSQSLYNSYEKVCSKKKVQLIDSNFLIKSSDQDPIHWSKSSHQIFGKEIAKIISNKF